MRTFAQMIARIKSSDEELMGSIVEASGYVLTQYHTNNRKVDGAGNNLAAQLIAVTPVWLQPSMNGWLQQGKRDATRSVEHWENVASAKITGFFRDQQVKREEAKAKRAAKAAEKAQAKPATEQQAPSEAEHVALPMLKSALIDDAGEMMELTSAELQAAMGAIIRVRMEAGQLRLAA